MKQPDLMPIYAAQEKKINRYTGATECNNAFICMQITLQKT